MDKKQKVYQKLNELNIKYEVVDHEPAYTIEEIEVLKLDDKGHVAKNLFLRDDRGKKHFLVVLEKNKKADLAKLRSQLGTSKLGFASEERLEKYLNLTKGSVTPLGVINDEKCVVTVVFDKDLKNHEKIGVHPNDNSSTVFMTFEDLKSVVENSGHSIVYAEV